ncbi:MAG: hypothetical protein A2342_04820 [Gallionellales bacterium RIFOXYB12_FULL_54_9]|nr:MAG: hypothetical protein A2342_04820 [Gallionellales bacterium RIFOXYB12_FULL_54_9]
MKMYRIVKVSVLFAALSGVVWAEPQLYETGPAEESSYVRFVNATDKDISVLSSTGAAKIALNSKAEGRVSRFYPVKAGTKLSATIQRGDKKEPVEVTGKPWEYITIAVLPGSGAQMETKIVRETPTDFNAMKSSVALFNLDAKCPEAVMQGGAKAVTILENVKSFSVARRLVNPVKLTATVNCGAAGSSIDLSQLQAGERYSVFMFSLKNARRVFFSRDVN